MKPLRAVTHIELSRAKDCYFLTLECGHMVVRTPRARGMTVRTVAKLTGSPAPLDFAPERCRCDSCPRNTKARVGDEGPR